MPVFQHATVALAMASCDTDLLRYAALLSQRKIVAEFRFVHVVTPAQRAPEFNGKQTLEQLQTTVRQHFDPSGTGTDPACEIREGVRIDTLLDAVTANQSDVILLGHRRSRSGRRSLARRLAMISPSSVWMVPEGSPDRISEVLAPVDYSANSAGSLSQAAAIVRQMGLPRCLSLHVYFDPSTIRYDEHVAEIRNQTRQGFEHFLESTEVYGQTIEVLFDECSIVAHSILRCATERAVDLIVMSTRGRSQAAAILLGSETSQTLSESAVPVLAVKQHGAHMSLLQALKDARTWKDGSPKTN